MPTFIELTEKERIRLFNSLKDHYNCSWDKIYPNFDRCRAMFFHYLAGRKLIPLNIFKKMQKETKISIASFKKVIRNKYEEKNVANPKENLELCEIFGILNGDGHLSGLNYEICVTGNINERQYALYVKKLFERNINLKFKFSETENAFKLRAYSKRLVTHLHRAYNLPLGNKIGSLRIPKFIAKNKRRLRYYIKGLFDTDGCFHIRRKKDPMILITSADQRYLNEVKKVLERLGFRTAKGGGMRIFIYHKEDICKFFKEIKPANYKHLKKYQQYLKLYKALIV